MTMHSLYIKTPDDINEDDIHSKFRKFDGGMFTTDDDGDWDGIWAFTKDNKLQLYQGTSMAAPIASAAIGNVIAKYKNASPFFPLMENQKSIPKTLFIQSKDDPWVPFLAAERLMEKMKFSKDQNFNKFIFTEKGGHNGFHGIQGCWGDQVVSKWFLSLKNI